MNLHREQEQGKGKAPPRRSETAAAPPVQTTRTDPPAQQKAPPRRSDTATAPPVQMKRADVPAEQKAPPRRSEKPAELPETRPEPADVQKKPETPQAVPQPAAPDDRTRFAGEPQYEYRPDEGEGGFGILFPVLLAKWRLIVLVTVCSVLAGGLYVRSMEPSYRAASTVEMTVRRPRILKQDEAVIDKGAYWNDEELLNTRVHILKSSRIRDRVLKKLVEDHPDLAATDGAARGAIAGVALTRLKKSRLLDISLVSKNRSLVVPVVNAYTYITIASVQDDLNQSSEAAVHWLQQQVLAQQEKVAEAEKTVAAFRDRHNADVLEKAMQTLEQSLGAMNDSVATVETKITLALGMVKALSAPHISVDDAGKLPSAMPHADQIQSSVQELAGLTKQRDLLLVRYTEEHPKVKELSSTVKSLEQQFTDMIQRARQTAKADLELVEQQARSLRGRKAQQEARLAELQKQMATFTMELNGLKRKQETDQISLNQLQQRIEEARLSAEENTTMVTLVQEAREPPAEVRPQTLRTLMFSGILGLALGCGLAYLSYNYEDLISHVAVIEHELGTPVIGIVPRVAGNPKTREMSLSCASDRFSPVAEAFAAIRTTLDAGIPKPSEAGRSILVTGTIPREGKTSTACNLSIAQAQGGRRVLLIDCDLRRPSLHNVFDVYNDEESFMRAILEGTHASFDRLPQQTDTRNLFVICTKHSSKEINPNEILNADNLRRLMQWAVSRFDFVIIDSPPVGVFSDALILSRVVDAVLVVCRCDKSRKMVTQHGLRDLTKIKSKVLGMIFCDFSPKHFAARLGYGKYYYGYHYDNYRYYREYNQEDTN